jgi:hypothetical protein
METLKAAPGSVQPIVQEEIGGSLCDGDAVWRGATASWTVV